MVKPSILLKNDILYSFDAESEDNNLTELLRREGNERWHFEKGSVILSAQNKLVGILYLKGPEEDSDYEFCEKKEQVIANYDELTVKNYGQKLSVFTDHYADEIYLFDTYGKGWKVLSLADGVNEGTKVINQGNVAVVFDKDADYLYGFASNKQGEFIKCPYGINVDEQDLKYTANDFCAVFYSNASDLIFAFSAVNNKWSHINFGTEGIQDCFWIVGEENIIIASRSANKAYIYNPYSVGFLEIDISEIGVEGFTAIN